MEDLDDQLSSEQNKNLVDRVIYNANNLATMGSSFDKFNIKKRWWTP